MCDYDDGDERCSNQCQAPVTLYDVNTEQKAASQLVLLSVSDTFLTGLDAQRL